MLARSEDDGDGRTIEGVAVPFGDVIDVWGERETFDPDTVFEGLDSAKLYYQHDTLIGSITSGENREDGLHITARIADTQQGRDAVALLRGGPGFAQCGLRSHRGPEGQGRRDPSQEGPALGDQPRELAGL